MKSLKVKEWCEKIKVNRFLFRTHKKKYLMTWNMYNPVTRVQNRDVSQRKDVIYKKRLFLWLQWLDNSEFTKKTKNSLQERGTNRVRVNLENSRWTGLCPSTQQYIGYTKWTGIFASWGTTWPSSLSLHMWMLIWETRCKGSNLPTTPLNQLNDSKWKKYT